MVKVKPIYVAHVVVDGGWFAIDVPAIEGCHSQAARIRDIVPMAREVIGLCLDVPEDSFDVWLNFR